MISLREITETDLPTIHLWRDDEDLVALLGAPFRYINIETDREWLSNYLRHRGREVRLAICTPATDGPVGLASLTEIDPVHRSAEVHLMVGNPAFRGRGVGSAALARIVRHATEDLNLHRIEARVLAENPRALHVYERAGFRREGVARDAVFKRGRYRDVVVLSFLAEAR